MRPSSGLACMFTNELDFWETVAHDHGMHVKKCRLQYDNPGAESEWKLSKSSHACCLLLFVVFT